MQTEYLRTRVHKAIYEADNQEQRDSRKQCLAEVFLNRHKSYSDPIWVDLYKKWLLAGGEKIELQQLKTYAAFNYKNMQGRRSSENVYETKSSIRDELNEYRFRLTGVKPC